MRCKLDQHLPLEIKDLLAQHQHDAVTVPEQSMAVGDGFGYEDGDPYAEFLPLAIEVNTDGDSEFMHAVVFVTEETQKGTDRSPQEYINPLLVLTGLEYAEISFVELHTRISDAL